MHMHTENKNANEKRVVQKLSLFSIYSKAEICTATHSKVCWQKSEGKYWYGSKLFKKSSVGINMHKNSYYNC
jgi:hypothetical protein